MGAFEISFPTIWVNGINLKFHPPPPTSSHLMAICHACQKFFVCGEHLQKPFFAHGRKKPSIGRTNSWIFKKSLITSNVKGLILEPKIFGVSANINILMLWFKPTYVPSLGKSEKKKKKKKKVNMKIYSSNVWNFYFHQNPTQFFYS